MQAEIARIRGLSNGPQKTSFAGGEPPASGPRRRRKELVRRTSGETNEETNEKTRETANKGAEVKETESEVGIITGQFAD